MILYLILSSSVLFGSVDTECTVKMDSDLPRLVWLFLFLLLLLGEGKNVRERFRDHRPFCGSLFKAFEVRLLR